MKKRCIILTTLLLTNIFVPAVHAEPSPPATILITEIQTGGLHDATEEFVELYNPRDTAVDITGWLLQYRAASSTASQTWPASSTKATVACPPDSAADCKVTMAPQSRLVFVHTIANIAGALPMTGGFSDKGGEIRLVQPGASPTIHDMVGYGNAADAEGLPAPAPAAGQSIKRRLDANASPHDTNNNADDFITACGTPSPGQDDTLFIPSAEGCLAAPEQPQTTEPASPPEDTPPTDPAETPAESTEPENITPPSYLPLLITEAFPDPASPQSDSADEFIELYNPNDTAITLLNYRLQTGADYRYSYTLGDTPLAPHAYVAITSAVSKLSLANSGSGVRLIDPNGAVAAEAPDYGDAKEGQSWMQDETGWHWTLTPTPNAANILTLPTPKPSPSATNTAPKKTSATKIPTPKVAAPKIAAPKAPAAKKTTSPAVTTTATAPVKPASEIQYWLLASLGSLAVGYVVYEYRENIARLWRKALPSKKIPAVEQD